MHIQLVPTASVRSTKRPRVLIAGGGVGGLAAALALRARGITDVTVLEREATSSAAARSTGLALWPNAMRALRLLDPSLQLDKSIAAAGVVLKGSDFSFDGVHTASSTSFESYLPSYGHEAVTLRWRALTSELASHLPLDCIRYDVAVRGYELHPDGSVCAILDSGRRPREWGRSCCRPAVRTVRHSADACGGG